MKVLHILDHSLPLHSGYTFRSRNIFDCQRGVGIEPVVLTSPKHEESFGTTPTSREIIDGVPYYRSGGVGRILPVYDEIRLLRKLQGKILEVAAREKPDIIHAHSPLLNGLPAISAGRKLGIPVVYEIRAFWEDAAVDLGTCREGGPRYRATRALETRVCRKADAVVTICASLRDDLIARQGITEDKLFVVGNAVDLGSLVPSRPDSELLQRWGIADDDLVLGFIGSFYHYEGLDLLLKAMPGIVGKYPEVKLLLVGGGPMEEELRKLAVESGVGDRVIFAGRVPHEKIPGVYAMVDVMVFPRLSMRLTETVTPLKPLESMALRTALLASDVGGHRELVKSGETGLLFRAGDENSLLARLEELLASRELRETLVERGEAFVRRERNWRNNGEKYLVVYQGILLDR